MSHQTGSKCSGKLERTPGKSLWTHQTPTKKVWDQFLKINRNYKSRTIPPLERGGNTITLADEIANTFADHYANISRDPHKKVNHGKTGKRRATI